MTKPSWQIDFTKNAAEQTKKLPLEVQRRVRAFLSERVATSINPRNLGEALAGAWTGHIRYRVGDYRIICRIEDETITILVIEIGHRREIYR
jgi:mRNA interferase RelE/StbE